MLQPIHTQDHILLQLPSNTACQYTWVVFTKCTHSPKNHQCIHIFRTHEHTFIGLIDLELLSRYML